jgi:hypothetical protein
MNVPRFNDERGPNAPSPVRPGKYRHSNWIRVFHVGGPFLRDSGNSARRRIFAIVARPKVDLGGKVIRRILIFDNHPDSLRLVSEQHLTSVVDPATYRHTRRSYIILGVALVLALAIGMLWPLL